MFKKRYIMKLNKRKFTSKENIIEDIKCKIHHWGTDMGLLHMLDKTVSTFGLSKLRIWTAGMFTYRIKDKATLK